MASSASELHCKGQSKIKFLNLSSPAGGPDHRRFLWLGHCLPETLRATKDPGYHTKRWRDARICTVGRSISERWMEQ